MAINTQSALQYYQRDLLRFVTDTDFDGLATLIILWKTLLGDQPLDISKVNLVHPHDVETREWDFLSWDFLSYRYHLIVSDVPHIPPANFDMLWYDHHLANF